MSHFKNNLPRCEVQALWSILAFVAATDGWSVVTSSDADACWRFASKLVLNGTRASKTSFEPTDNCQPLPPSPAQLDCCQTEISFLTSILRASEATKWEKHDTVVVEIFKRAFDLQADEYTLDGHLIANVLPFSENQKNEMKNVRRLWGSLENVSSKDSSEVGGNLEAGNETVATLYGQPAMLPSSLISRQCLSLLWAWVQKIPAKKALFNRFVGTMRTLVQYFTGKALDTEKIKMGNEPSRAAPDLFALAFSTATPAASVPTANQKSLYFREVAAYIKIVSAISVRQRVAMMESIESGIKIPSAALLAEEVSLEELSLATKK